MNSVKLLARTYWAIEGRMLAGAYPGDPDERVAEDKIRALHDCGVRTFINLMEANETDKFGNAFAPYDAHFANIDPNLVMHRLAIQDLDVPTPQRMDEILATIKRGLENGAVYVHCWGGRGRTGSVVGTFLVKEGLATAEDFVDVIRELRRNDAGGGKSPETHAQIEFVRDYVKTRNIG